MASTLTKPNPPQEATRLDGVRPRMAKAVTPSHTLLRDVIERAIRQQGNVKATAADMGIDRAQLYRQLQSGHLTIERLEALGPEFGASLGKALVDACAPLDTPRLRALRLLAEARRIFDELEQVVEHVA